LRGAMADRRFGGLPIGEKCVAWVRKGVLTLRRKGRFGQNERGALSGTIG
jgi:hypothetical protein